MDKIYLGVDDTPRPRAAHIRRKGLAGYVLTGAQVRIDAPQPMMLQTSRAGVLAVGDVRSGSIKRVASAVDEGSMAVRLIHDHLARYGRPVDRQRFRT